MFFVCLMRKSSYKYYSFLYTMYTGSLVCCAFFMGGVQKTTFSALPDEECQAQTVEIVVKITCLITNGMANCLFFYCECQAQTLEIALKITCFTTNGMADCLFFLLQVRQLQIVRFCRKVHDPCYPILRPIPNNSVFETGTIIVRLMCLLGHKC